MEFIKKLISYVTDSSEIADCLKNVDLHFDRVIRQCCRVCIEQKEKVNMYHKLQIEMLLDFLHDELNTSHWSEVSLAVRHAFQAASFLKVIILLKQCNTVTVDILKEMLKIIDLGLLLGAPLTNNSDLLNRCASLISSTIQTIQSKETSFETIDTDKASKRKYIDNEVYERLQGRSVIELKCPSLETFHKFYFLPKLPVKLQGW